MGEIIGPVNLEDNKPSTQEGPRNGGYQLPMRGYHVEFPTFDGQGLKDWLYKCEQFFEVDETPKGSKEVEEEKDESKETEELMVDLAGFFTMIAQELETGENGSILPHVSVHAMNGVRDFRTMRVTVFVKEKVVHVLIDTRSTHNFLDLNTARRLGCMLTTISPFVVSVVDRKKIQSNYVCRKLAWKMQGITFDSDMLVLPIGGCNVVLGIQWLISLGDIMWNFKKLKMEFNIKGHKISLREYNPQRLDNSTEQYGEIIGSTLCIMYDISGCDGGSNAVSLYFMEISKNVDEKADLQLVLQNYKDLLEVPTELPPSRLHDHKIILKEGTPPVNISPYKYPTIQKNEIEKMVNEMLTILRSHGLFVKQSKYAFGVTQIDYLGYVISELRVAMYQQKVGEFVIEIDVSSGGIGAVLAQNNRPIAFFSQGFCDKNKALSAYEKELLALTIHTRGAPKPYYTYSFGVLRRKGKLMIGNDPDLRSKLLDFYHADSIRGHSVCQKCKGETVACPGLMQPLPIPTEKPPSLLPYMAFDSHTDVVDISLQSREATMRVLKANLSKAQSKMKTIVDGKRTDRNYSVGDWVFVKLQPYRQNSLRDHGFQKLSAKYFGPFQIVVRVGKVAYTFDLPATSKIHPTFHIFQLKKKLGSNTAYVTLPMVQTDSGPVLRVLEAILDKYLAPKNGQAIAQVLIKWMNAADKDSTWEDLTSLEPSIPT
ncbi:hypothetical protein FXO37_03370 [Capsicum annuum]|nr:hypothetical protein FXO37_03370 [Capsicum annuum]